MKFDLIKHLPVSLSIFFCTFWNVKYTLRLALYLKTLPVTATLQPALSGYCWVSAREQEAVITTLVWEPEKQVRGVRLGCHPAVAGWRKKQSDTWVAVALHVIELRISLVRLCVGFEKNTRWIRGSPKKKLTAEGSKADQPKRLWLGLILGFPPGYFSTFLWKIDWMGWCQPVTTTMAALCNGNCSDISIIGGMPGSCIGLLHNIG